MDAMVKMDPEVKGMWLTALRSGKYKQTKAFLKRINGHCCLGVLSDIHSKTTGGGWWTEDGKYLDISGNSDESVLTADVGRWAGLTSELDAVYGGVNPRVEVEGEVTTLACLNDQGMTFAEIANIIEEQL